MKKDRDCGNNMYPVYPMPYMGPNMMMGMNMPMDNYNTNNYSMMDNSLANQIKALEKRVSNLEAIVSNTNYNNSTYQMM